MIGLPNPYRNWERLIGQIGNDVVNLFRQQRQNREKGIISQMFNNLQRGKNIDYNQLLNLSPESQSEFAKLFALNKGIENQKYNQEYRNLQLKRLKQIQEEYEQKKKLLETSNQAYNEFFQNPDVVLQNPKPFTQKYGQIGLKVLKDWQSVNPAIYQRVFRAKDKNGNEAMWGILRNGKVRKIHDLGKTEEVGFDSGWKYLRQNTTKILNGYNTKLADLKLRALKDPTFPMDKFAPIYRNTAKQSLYAALPAEVRIIADKIEKAYQNPQDKLKAVEELYKEGKLMPNPPKEIRGKHPEGYWRNLGDDVYYSLLNYFKLENE